MKKIIWVLGSDKEVVASAQKSINESGGMKAICLMNYASVENAVARLASYGKKGDMPSLLIADYESGLSEDFAGINLLTMQPAFSGIPVFIMCKELNAEIEDECYKLGATVVLSKPFSESDILRIERTSWQQEMTRSYEQMIERQASMLESKKEIEHLNEMLSSRNELLRRVMGRYFSEEVVNHILEKPENDGLGGKKAVVTVMMADLRGFTSMSDRLPGEVVVDILDHFLGEMTRIIKDNGGTVIEIIGDEILAVFGEPLSIQCPEEKALISAIMMQNKMHEVNRYNFSKDYPKIEMGIGIHTGEVFIGNIGSEYLMRYNVIGQAVNLCSRIENYTFGGQVLVSLETIKEIKDKCIVGDTFWITMKGVRKQIPICEIIQIDIEGDQPYVLVKEKAMPMTYLEKEPRIMIYVIQDKFIGEFSIFARAIEISETKIMIEIEDEDLSALALYCEVELLVQGHNAYAKVIKVSGNKLLMHFTYKSEDFMYAVCN